MQDSYLKVSDEVVYRNVSGELVMIEVKSGTFYHFTEESKEFFDFFREPRKLRDYVSSLCSENREEAERDLKGFVSLMVEKSVLTPCAGSEADGGVPARFVAPRFLRTGEHRLEEINFHY